MQTASDSTINGITIDAFLDATVTDLEGINAGLQVKLILLLLWQIDHW